MSITYSVLGDPGKDNAAFVHVNTGQRSYRLLFDCGEMCLAQVGLAEIQAIDHLCFSHLHMDHVGGFDSFFRAVFNRDDRANLIWGPPDTAQLIGYRMRAYQWNFKQRMSAIWQVNDISPDHYAGSRFKAREGFARRYPGPSESTHDGVIIATADFTVTALTMDHLTPSLAYVVREQPRVNIDTAAMQRLGLPPGPWLRLVKGHVADPPETVDIAGKTYALEWLQAQLIVRTPGASFAYLTDFLMDDTAISRLAPALHGCGTVICECSYTSDDRELAERYHHMYPAAVGAMARRAEIEELILFHLSDRYRPAAWQSILADVRQVFPNARFPQEWAGKV